MAPQRNDGLKVEQNGGSMAGNGGRESTTHPTWSADDLSRQSDPLLALLRGRFGHDNFRPGQRAVIEALQRDHAALAVFPTGAGKSLCAQLPALLFDGVTIIVSPLIALMKDQCDALQQRGIPAARLDSSLSAEALRQVNDDLRSGRLKLLYVAPERFNNERFLDQIGRLPIALFAVDEAHCISEWGHAFRPDYLKLARTAQALGVARVLAMTATATPAVVEDICRGFGIPAHAAIVASFYRPELCLLTSPTPAAQRDDLLLARLTERPPGTGIVYVTRQQTAERVAARLAEAGCPARAYHAGMADDERTSVQDWWAAGETGLVVATVAFGMGIDKAAVRYVYHYDLPKGPEAYSQEIGRAGRDGQEAIVELLGGLEDVATLENFTYGDTPIPQALRALVDEIATAEEESLVDLTDLSNRLDMRPLVLRTALTYLELDGLLHQGTPLYASYQLRPLVPLPELLDRFAGERRHFLAAIMAAGRPGRIWLTLDPSSIAIQLGQERQRIIRALDYLAEQELVELRVADVRYRYRRLVPSIDRAAVTAVLVERFADFERRQIERLHKLLAIVTDTTCQTSALLTYFGEQHGAPCGHCTVCLTGRPVLWPATGPTRPIDAVISAEELAALVAAHPGALGHPRQQTRFLCGLASPALSQAKLTRHPLFGVLADQRFTSVLTWCGASE